MKTIVVDASVALKWFLPEIHSEAAGRLLKHMNMLLAPDLIWTEVGNALWKKFHRKEVSKEEAQQILKDFLRFPLQIYNTNAVLETAFNIAAEHGVTVYDSCYLALSIGRECPLVTADRKFYEMLHKKPVGSRLLWVEDI